MVGIDQGRQWRHCWAGRPSSRQQGRNWGRFAGLTPFFVVCAALLASPSFGAPVDVGANLATSNPEGELSCKILSVEDANGYDASNLFKLRENAVNLTTNPSCSQCVGGDSVSRLCLIDADETAATFDWRICSDGTDFSRLVNTGSDQITNAQLLVGTGNGTGAYVSMSGDATIDNTGAVAVVDDSHAHTGATISGLDISDDTNLAVTAPIVLTGDTLSCASASGAQAGCLSSTDWTTFNGKAANAFTTMDAPAGTDPVADSATDTLALVATGSLTITGNSTTDTLTFDVTETDPGVPLLALADYGDVCAANESVARNAGDTANVCITPLTAEVDGSTTNEINTLVGDSGTATDALAVTIAGGAGITTSSSATTDTVTITAADTSATNELQNLFATIDAPSGTDPVADSTTDTLTLAAGGIVSITGDSSTDTITISATEVDGSTTNEIEVVDEAYSAANFNGDTASGVSQDDLYDLIHAGDADDDGKPDILDTTTNGFVKTTGGTGAISIDTSTYLTAEVDGSTTNEINTFTADTGGATTGLGITLAGAGIVSTARSGDTVTITGTEVDGSTSNEINTLVGDSGTGTDALAATIAGGAGIVTSSSATTDTVTLATASTEASFLTDGGVTDLTCGAAAQGKLQTLDDGQLQWCDGATTSVLRRAAYGNSSGVATSATALAANGANCSAGQYPLGVDASGAVESCTTDDDVPEVGDFGALTFAQVGAGTNTNALVVGAGGSLSTSGGGTISATTAGALAANPADCSANQFATTIAASGDLTCAAISDADVPDTITASNYLPLSGGTITGALNADGQFRAPNSTATIGTECDAAGEAGRLYVDTDAATGSKLKVCTGVGGWENADSGTASSVAFSAITTATNTTATMTVGTGASLTTSGSGTITATDVACTGCVATTETASGVTLDTEWDTAAEINAATTDDDFVTLTGTQTISGAKTYSGTNNFTSGTLRLPNSTTAMTTCTVGDIKQDTDAAAGARLLMCIATDTPIALDNPFGSQINTSEMENTLSFSSAQVLDLATNDADLRLAQTASDGTNEGSFYLDSTSNEPEWYSGGALNKLENYAKLTGRAGGQALYGGDGSASGQGLTLIATSRSDASDDGVMILQGGGADSADRGARIALSGNEYFANLLGGQLFIDAGNDSTGGISFRSGSTPPTIRMTVDHDGDICIGGVALNSCTKSLGFSGQTARTVAMERHTTSNTAGNSLTVTAGGATSAATDKDGGTLYLAPGVSTGQGKGYAVIQSPTRATSTGTSDQSMVDRLVIGGKRTLTDASATAVLNATVASGSMAAGIIHYSIEATNGTDYQVEVGEVHYTAVNKAGTVTSAVLEIVSDTRTAGLSLQALSSGTLATDWTISAANPAVISVNANTSLTPSTGYPRITFWVENLTDQAVAPQ